MSALRGLQALIVEDEGSVALLIEEMLTDFGCAIAASIARFDAAARFAAEAAVDFALLDVNLQGAPAYPIARVLRQRGIPVIFSTGYGAGSLPDEFGDCPVLGKPFRSEDLRRQICRALGR